MSGGDNRRSGRGGFWDRMRGYVVTAVVLAVAGVLLLLVELQSPSLIYWTGEQVHGVNDGGIVYYHVDGEQYTIDAPGAAPAHPTPVTVFIDPDDPGRAALEEPARWFDAGFIVLPFALAAGALAVGAVRTTRRRTAPLPEFGGGLDEDFIAKELRRRDGGGDHSDTSDRR